jgi:hypothetical protein
MGIGPYFTDCFGQLRVDFAPRKLAAALYTALGLPYSRRAQDGEMGER